MSEINCRRHADSELSDALSESPRPGSIQRRSQSPSEHAFKPAPMCRKDSGYESATPISISKTISSQESRRVSTTSSGSSQPRKRRRPAVRTTATSRSSYSQGRRLSSQSLNLNRKVSQQQQWAYFHFPAPEVSLTQDEEAVEDDENPVHPPPPQTTHYWTSDRTRRLEYAAIDAASRGVKGWILRNVVPDCFIPRENRRLGFDDDRGSVRRYRLEMDCDEAEEKQESSARRKKRSWIFR